MGIVKVPPWYLKQNVSIGAVYQNLIPPPYLQNYWTMRLVVVLNLWSTIPIRRNSAMKRIRVSLSLSSLIEMIVLKFMILCRVMPKWEVIIMHLQNLYFFKSNIGSTNIYDKVYPRLAYAHVESTTYIKNYFIASLTKEVKFETVFL